MNLFHTIHPISYSMPASRGCHSKFNPFGNLVPDMTIFKHIILLFCSNIAYLKALFERINQLLSDSQCHAWVRRNRQFTARAEAQFRFSIGPLTLSRIVILIEPAPSPERASPAMNQLRLGMMEYRGPIGKFTYSRPETDIKILLRQLNEVKTDEY